MEVVRQGTREKAAALDRLAESKQILATMTMGFSAIAICIAAAQAAPQQVPVRTLAPPTAVTTTPVAMVFGGVEQIGGGKVLVNEASKHRLLLFDPRLESFTVLRDSVPGLATSYGSHVAMSTSYLGDSTLLLDYDSQALLVLDPAGQFVRTMALPNATNFGLVTRGRGPQADAKGRLIYLGLQATTTTQPDPAQPRRVTRQSDSAPLLRGDFDTRKVDTIAWIKMVAAPMSVRTETTGKTQIRQIVNPLQTIDDWTIASDGSVALVRGHDYHIDWINPDGTKSASGKMPFDWRRLTDGDKQHLIDSARALHDSVVAARAAATASRGGGRGDQCVTITDGRDVVGPCNSTTQTTYVPPNEIPDYYPPLTSGSVRADRDGNVWIVPMTTAQSTGGDLVYDVVNRRGELFEHVQMPARRSLAGFGPGGVIYLMHVRGPGDIIIERTHVQ